jgi:SAM-dependent methyltransferase
MEHFYHNIGEDWFTYPELYKQTVNNTLEGIFVEVGSWKGRSAAFLGVEIFNSGKPIKLYCVDTWQGSVEHQDMDCIKNDLLYNEFIANTKPIESVITPLRIPSLEAAMQFEDNSIDFVFLDASHEYEDVKADIDAWYTKVKPGGIIAGHDYWPNGAAWPGVLKAVNEWAENKGKHITTSENCWITNKCLITNF